MIFTLINGVWILLFVKYCIDNKSSVCYNLIYLYSSIQMQLQKIKVKSKRSYIENCYFECIDYMNNSHQLNCIENVCDMQQSIIMSQKYKMIIYNNNYNKICYFPPTKYDLMYEVSNVSFISFKVTVNSIEYTVKLSTPEYNFYIVNNVINAEFIKYYFNKYLNIHLLDDIDYTIEIVDDSVNFVTLNKNNSLIFQKDTYIIK